MFNIGVPELVIIFFVILIVFGPKRLPEIGRSMAKALRTFKKASVDIKQALDQEPPEEIKQEVRQQFEQNQGNKNKTAG
ncbi:MAG: twin-arginine translocase TatA/TatE family subunit [Candidatus Omnitrophota bacterium]